MRHCVGCAEKIVSCISNWQLRNDVGELYSRLHAAYPKLPLCEDCYTSLLECPRRTRSRKLRRGRDTNENIWCENCFISVKKGNSPCRYFGEKHFCHHCSTYNYTRYQTYLKIATLLDREVDPKHFRSIKPTHANSCAECHDPVRIGGSFHENKFYCARHSPLIFGLPPFHVLQALSQ
jgi:hypothetical protein